MTFRTPPEIVKVLEEHGVLPIAGSKPKIAGLFVAVWKSAVGQHECMVCLASDREDALAKFRKRFDDGFEGSEFLDEKNGYIAEHVIDDVIWETFED